MTTRAWIKVQLKDSHEVRHATGIVAYWKSKQQAAKNIVRAISLYYALLSGDTTLLLEYFPLLRVVSSSPVASTARRSPADEEVTVSFQAKSEEEDIADFLSEFM